MPVGIEVLAIGKAVDGFRPVILTVDGVQVRADQLVPVGTSLGAADAWLVANVSDGELLSWKAAELARIAGGEAAGKVIPPDWTVKSFSEITHMNAHQRARWRATVALVNDTRGALPTPLPPYTPAQARAFLNAEM